MYNGHKNYETWNINLWLANDHDLYKAVRAGKAQQVYPIHGQYTAKSAKELCQRMFRDNKTPDGVDLRNEEIDWWEVADTMNDLAGE